MNCKEKSIHIDCFSKDFNNFDELKYDIIYFSSGEIQFKLKEKVDNKEVIIFHSFCIGNFNESLLKLQIICDTLNSNNVKKIKYFSPFIPYLRQDKIGKKNESLGTRFISSIFNSCKIKEIKTYDVHSLDIVKFFKGKFFNLSFIPVFIKDIENRFNKDELMIVFPDEGSCSKYLAFFRNANFQSVTINKIRIEGEIIMSISKDLKNKIAIIIDDIIDTGDTIISAEKMLIKKLVKSIFIYSVHGLFSNNALDRLEKTSIQGITISNSLKLASSCSHSILNVIDI